MLSFLKRFGLGIFYTITSPFYIAFFLLWTLYTIIVFFIELIKGIISFFKGKNFYPIIKEDQEAKIILSTLDDQNKINNVTTNSTQNTTNQTININVGPGVKPEDIIKEINNAANNMNQQQIEQQDNRPEININNVKEINFDSSNNQNNNGGSL